MSTVIIRHRRENLKKCSLRGLETRSDLKFFTYPTDSLPNLEGFLLLKVGAQVLTESDADRNLLLIDGTWRLAQVIEKQLPHPLETRSLPPLYRTAYPRKQTECPNPEEGLSSVEALFLCHKILNREHTGILDFYFWKNEFLKKNNINQTSPSLII